MVHRRCLGRATRQGPGEHPAGTWASPTSTGTSPVDLPLKPSCPCAKLLCPALWRMNWAWEDTSAIMALFHLLDKPLLSLKEFTDIVNGCALDALLRNSFAILRIVSMARYLQLKTQEIHEALKEAHKVIGLAKIIGSPDCCRQAWSHRAEHTVCRSTSGRPGQGGRAQQHRAARTTCPGSNTASSCHHRQYPSHRTGPYARLKASIASEREVSARSSQQATSFAATEAHFQQQLASLKARGAYPHFDVPVQSFIIVGCTGGQRINIVVASTVTPVSGCKLYLLQIMPPPSTLQ